MNFILCISVTAYTAIDLPLLNGQILLAHVTFVESTTKFFIQLLPLEAAKLQSELAAVSEVIIIKHFKHLLLLGYYLTIIGLYIIIVLNELIKLNVVCYDLN